MTVIATEFTLSTGKATGHSMEFSAGTLQDGAASALYTARLTDGRAAIGTTGRVIYPHGILADVVWVITRGD